MTSGCECPKDLNQLLMIEYPGVVKNVDKALATLGGVSSIERVFDSQKDRLELKFRKADPLSHAAYGDRVPKKCLVLEIKKISDADQYQVEVIGKIQMSFRFDTMAEFQWLPMQRTNSTNSINPQELPNGIKIQRTMESLNPKYVSALDDILPIKNPFDNSLKNFNPDAPLLILPALFSRFDTPREIHQPHPKFRSKEMREEFERQQSLSIIGRTRKKRSTMSYLLNFNDPVPEKAPEKLVKERPTLSSQERGMVPILVRCFERQKIWSKAALCCELNCLPIDIKYILPLVAFHYLTGPFRTMWVKYGYDPHKEASSKVLQTLDFRMRSFQDQQEYSRRSIHQYQLPLRKNPEKSKSSQQVDLKSVMSQQSTSAMHEEVSDDNYLGLKNSNNLESMCKFRKNLIPPARQLSYQLKDICLDEVQAIVHSNDGKEQECTEKDGWLPEGSIEKIRKIMTKSLIETLETVTNQLGEFND